LIESDSIAVLRCGGAHPKRPQLHREEVGGFHNPTRPSVAFDSETRTMRMAFVA
jgi:hypothetical protein